jgi:hypothetical protein
MKKYNLGKIGYSNWDMLERLCEEVEVLVLNLKEGEI